MKKILLSLFFASILLSPTGALQASEPVNNTPGDYLVTFSDNSAVSTVFQSFSIEHYEKIATLGVYSVKITPEKAILLARSAQVRHVEPDAAVALSFVPNDIYFPAQTYAISGNFTLAWDKTIGSPLVTVAVIDTGVDGFHEDLQGKLWMDANKNFGYDFVNRDTDPQDDHGHGTGVAGIIAATSNNGIGISGLSNSKIMALKAIDSKGRGKASDVAEAIHYAADNGARVINMSVSLDEASTVLDRAVSYATGKGSIVIAATGNHCQTKTTQEEVTPKEEECIDVYSQLAKNPQVIAVTALGSNGKVASFAHTDKTVDISAPGEDIYSTAWLPSNIFNAYGRTYRGTSFSAPQVSAVAALLLAQDPSLSPDQIRKRILGSAIKVPAMNGAAHTAEYGYGKLDAYQALTYDKAPPVITANLFVGASGSYRLGGSIVDDSIDSPVGTIPTGSVKTVKYYIDGGSYFILNQTATARYALDATTASLPAGEHTIVIEATDTTGNTSTRTFKTSEAVVGNVSTNKRDYRGIVTEQSAYPTIMTGQKKEMKLSYKNTGSSVWLKDKVRLATNTPRDRASRFADSSWLSPNRIAMKENFVAPGETAHFEFTITGPSTAGVSKEYFALVADGVGWFADVGAYWNITVEKPSYSAQVVAQSPYLVMGRGDSREVWVEYKNTGNTAWDASTLMLGTNNARDRASVFYDPSATSGWRGNNRVKMSRSVVQPGETVRFTFTIKAPSIPAVYREHFRLVADGVGWLKDDGLFWAIAVQ